MPDSFHAGVRRLSLVWISLTALNIFVFVTPCYPQQVTKRSPEAKTNQEAADYNSVQSIKGGAALERAVSSFSSKYPNRDLRVPLYLKVMNEYYKEDNVDKLLQFGRAVIYLDPDNTLALALTAGVLADSLDQPDENRAAKISEIKANATRALATADAAPLGPAGGSTAQISAWRKTLKSMARSALGTMEIKTGEDAAAEMDLKIAADLSAPPDPFIWYHLAISQDRQGKYKEALLSVERASKYVVGNQGLARLISVERNRLLERSK